MNDEERAPFAFKCPQYLRDAMTAAARAEYCSRSDVVRRALIKVLSEQGILPADRAREPA
jgi:hypothetical protein